MQQHILILGGARSGKSRYAEKLVRSYPGPWAYVATAEALDAEMAERIDRHKEDRGEGWITFEEPLDVSRAFALAERRGCGVILVDCLTLWLSNLMGAGLDHEAAANTLIDLLPDMRVPIVLVSNEVGLGLVPETPLGREFRDAQGRLNQRVAEAAERVEFVAAGLPLVLKG